MREHDQLVALLRGELRSNGEVTFLGAGRSLGSLANLRGPGPFVQAGAWEVRFLDIGITTGKPTLMQNLGSMIIHTPRAQVFNGSILRNEGAVTLVESGVQGRGRFENAATVVKEGASVVTLDALYA